ncbi:MAG: RhuM family protein [Methanobacteriaceae archaeon]
MFDFCGTKNRRFFSVSERRFNQKITDIYATSYDYNKSAEITKYFFASVQNKLIYAISGNTAAEIISQRSDVSKKYMGLTSFKYSNGKVMQSDVVISKNYLNKMELNKLNSLVEGFLILAEDRAKREIPMAMGDWADLLNKYITISDYLILNHKGNISNKEAQELAINRYNEYRVIQDSTYKSDFDEVIESIKRLEGKK